MSTENPGAHRVTRFDMTGNGTITDSGVTLTDANEMSGHVMLIGDRGGDHVNQEDSGTCFHAAAMTIDLLPGLTIGTHFYFVQNTIDPMTIAAPEGATIYLGRVPTTAIVSDGIGSTCLLIYSAEGVWQGLFSGAWSSAE